jgi:hypothetical protein
MDLLTLPYIRWLIIFVIIPSATIWLFYWRYLINYKKTIICITLLSFCWGLGFDLVASPVIHVWDFNNNLGVTFLELPLEEYIFLLLVPQELAVILLLLRKEIRK